MMLDPDYLPDYLSVSYDSVFIEHLWWLLLKVVLSYLNNFQPFSSKDHAKKKSLWNQINTGLGGSFSSKIVL